MPYTRKQKRVAYHLYSVGKKKGASRKELLSALATGLVEANLGNPNYGDRDSVGWRQERSHYGSVGKRLNVRGGAARYYQETKAAGRGRGKSVGQLSQAVQRSAFPARYDQRVGQAKDLLGWLERKYGSGGGPAPAAEAKKVTKTVTPGVDNSGLRQQAKLSYLSQRGRPDALLGLAEALKGAGDVAAVTKTRVVRHKGRSRPAGAGGGVRDGGGYAGTEKVAKSATRGFAVSSAKRARQLTSSGNTSDHYVGNKTAYAHDLPAVGAQGDRIFRKVAKRFGVNARPGSYQRHTVKIGGRRYSVQLLWKVEGHHDHVHVGVKRI